MLDQTATVFSRAMSRRSPWMPSLAIAAFALATANGLFAQDINGNGVRDALDLRNGTSDDCDHDGVPDEVALDRPAFSAAIEHSNDSTTLTTVNGTAALDFDLDGDLDLVLAARLGSNNSSLTFWLNDGGPALLFAERYTVINAFCYAVRTADLNGDGRLDVIASDSGFPSVVVMLTSGAGAFAAPMKLSAGSRGTGLAVADFDVDGDIDPATAGFAPTRPTSFSTTGTARSSCGSRFPAASSLRRSPRATSMETDWSTSLSPTRTSRPLAWERSRCCATCPARAARRSCSTRRSWCPSMRRPR